MTAASCPCTVDCIDNCMGEWNIYCSNLSTHQYDVHSLFTNDQCSNQICCGDIINQTEKYFVCSPNLYQNVICNHNVGLDIALIASLAMAGVIVFFFIFLMIRYIYKKFKKDEMQKLLDQQRKLQQESKSQKPRKKRYKKMAKNNHDENQATNLLDDQQDDKSPSTPISLN